MHFLHGLQHSLGLIRLPDQIQYLFPRHKPSTLQPQPAISRIHSGAQPQHNIAQQIIVAQMFFEFLKKMLAERRIGRSGERERLHFMESAGPKLCVRRIREAELKYP
jgi:hypothetical protein